MANTISTRVVPVSPEKVRVEGVVVLPRRLHQDPRGFLVETLRKDDRTVAGERFAMSYTSVTIPGEYRDRDRWHVHRVQTDRFIVPLGEMILALWDGRPASHTQGMLDVLRLAGTPIRGAAHPTPREVTTHLVTIPPGVFHCIGNLSEEPFVLQNYPTEYYDPKDEGRVPFANQIIAELGRAFSWDLVASGRTSEGD